MSESNGNNKTNGNTNGKNGKDKKDIDNSFEKNLDVYMYGCTNFDRELSDKAMYNLAKKLNTKVEVRHVDIDEPKEIKIIYSLENDGEMIYHREDERNLIEVEVASPASRPQDNLFYIIASFKPQKKSRAFCYHDSDDEAVTLPKYISHNPLEIEDKEIKDVAEGYEFKSFGFNLSSIGIVKFDKKPEKLAASPEQSNLEQKVEEKSK